MNEVEYAKKMAEINAQEKNEAKQIESEKPSENKKEITHIPTDAQSQQVKPEEIDDLIAKVDETRNEEEIDKKLNIEKENEEEVERQSEELKNMVSLREFMKTEEFLRLGTKARIPVALDLNGYKVKVFVRALSRNEIQQCRVEANNKKEDMDFIAVLKACTDENGQPFEREILEQLGYARIRDISEAIGLASGENPANMESNVRKKVIDNFLQKIEDEA